MGRTASMRIRSLGAKRHYADPSKGPATPGGSNGSGSGGSGSGGLGRSGSGMWQPKGTVEERLDRVDRLLWKGVMEPMSTRDDDLHRHSAPAIAARFLGTRDGDGDSDKDSDEEAADAADVAKLVGSVAGMKERALSKKNKAAPVGGWRPSMWAKKLRGLAAGRAATAAVAATYEKLEDTTAVAGAPAVTSSSTGAAAAYAVTPSRPPHTRGLAPVRRDAALLRLLRRRTRSLGDLLDVEAAAGGRGGVAGLGGSNHGPDASSSTLQLYATPRAAKPVRNDGGGVVVMEMVCAQPSRRTVEAMLVALPESQLQRRRRRQSYPSNDNVAWKQETIHAAIY
jgi:hypothetical protein